MSDSKAIARAQLDATQLDPDHYLLSLVRQAQAKHLISPVEVGRLQRQVAALLEQSLREITGGVSSSVATEVAENALLSLLYQIDAALVACGEPEAALAMLLQRPLAEIRQRGVELVRAALRRARQLHAELLQCKLAIPLQAYHDTIDHALPEFLNRYDAAQAAHLTVASIDYPLAVEIERGNGIFYIVDYLERLRLENSFVQQFPLAAVVRLLTAYSQVYRLDYREALINLCEVVANNAACAALAGADPASLLLTESQLQQLADRLQTAAVSDLTVALARVWRQLPTAEPMLQQYLERYTAKSLLPRLLQMRETGTLDKLALVELPATVDSPLQLFEQAMSEADWRQFWQRLRRCRASASRARLIKQRLRSRQDFVDLLQHDRLSAADYQALFSSLGPLEHALLAEVAFPEELREGSLKALAAQAEASPDWADWQQQYWLQLRQLSASALDEIERALQALLKRG